MDPRVELAAFLIQLGVTTVAQVRAVFAQDSDDDAVLAALMADLDRRIARRG